MNNLKTLTYDQVNEDTQKIFDGLKQKIGMVPNIYAAIAHSPVMLKALLAYGETIKSGEFSPKETEAIALTTGEENSCQYCLSAHSAIAQKLGFNEQEIVQLRKGGIEDTKLKALTALTREIVAQRGYPSHGLIEEFFSVGYSQAALAELIGLISLNIFTNYFNHIAKTEIDFAEVK